MHILLGIFSHWLLAFGVSDIYKIVIIFKVLEIKDV